ncbi:hypothetical protein ACF064_15190 [Streptomyces sp. NPDC015492]|uniref:hypothetical protein n=1 Tax=Streptomyces sp. NPDC015492 TaxID=3364958 RepID=UPI0037011A61
MSASDQDTPAVKAPEPAEAPEAEEADAVRRKAASGDADGPEAGRDDPSEAADPDDQAEEEGGDVEDVEDVEDVDGPDAADGDDEDVDEEGDDPADGEGLTPKQARRLRVAAASVLLVAMAIVLVIRLASRTSVLVVGVYGLAMILCGIVIELSRNGRTRLGTWLLVVGLLGALALDWLVLP